MNDETSVPPRIRGRAKVVRHAFALLLQRTARRVKAGTRSPATLDMQRQHVRYLLEQLPGRTPLERCTPARLARVLEREGEGRRGRELSGGTLRKRASTLAQALELAGRRPRLPEIPYRYTPRGEHLADFAAYCKLRDALPRIRRLWFVADVWTGQRRIDLEAMVREDLDPDAGWVRIRARKTNRGRPGGRFHAAPELLRELADHWRQLPAGAKLVPAWPHAHSDLPRLSARLGLPRMTPHRLRHTFFTWYVAANGFTPELLELGGWKDLRMPALVYAHAAPPRLREQIERTHRLVVAPRRAPKKVSPAPARADEAGPHDLPSHAAPKPAHEDHASRQQDAIVPDRVVPRDRVELSTHGFSVRKGASLPAAEIAGVPVGRTHEDRSCLEAVSP